MKKTSLKDIRGNGVVSMEELNKIISGLYAKIDNQEKIIRDLQEKSKSTYYITDDEYIKITESHCSNLQQRINKAIEYIEENKLNGNKISEMLCGSEIVKLLEILKGENDE